MAWQRLACLLLVAVVVVNGQTIQQQTCSKSKNSVDIQPGSDAMLGGIMTFSRPGAGGYGCGTPYGSMQALEAMRWVLDLLNKKNEYLQTEFLDNTYIPGVTLGMRVVNNCNGRPATVAAVGEVYPGLGSDGTECGFQSNQMVFGIVGASSSDQASDLSLALQPHEIPLISYEATAPQLTASGKYPNFMRTVAPDSALTEVILQVLLNLNWKYVTVVYDTGTYGKTAYSELLTKIVNNGLCLTAGVPVDGSDLSDENMDRALNMVLSKEATGVVFFGAQDMAKALLRRAGADSRIADTGRLQWIMADFPIENGLNIPYMRGIISVTLAYRFIVEFEDHWVRLDEASPSAENPWFQAWFAEKNDCSYTPTGTQKNCKNLYPGMSETEKERKKRQEFQQDQYVEPTVMAIFTYAKALRAAQKDKCAGSTTSCAAFTNMNRKDFFDNYLKKVDFVFSSDERVPSLASKNVLPYNAAKNLAFTAQGDIKGPSFYVWNFNDIESGVSTGAYTFKRVGTYINQFLEFNTQSLGMYNVQREQRLVPFPTSLCPSSPCRPCLGLPSDVKYYFEQGDLIINGIFSLHNQGSTPMTCGKLKSANQVMYLEAMIYAVKFINDDNTILPGVKLGALGLDDCSSNAIGHALVSQIQRGNLKIQDINRNSLNPQSIEAYLAADTSVLTDPFADMVNIIHRPLVGYRAGSSKLDNQGLYPYFVRAGPYIRAEIRAIIQILKNYGWMHVKMITSDALYAQDAYKLFRELAAKEGICVVATHNLGSTNVTASMAVKELGISSDVPVTVAILERMDQQRLLLALQANPMVQKAIALIASSGWGNSHAIPAELQSAAEGVMTLSLAESKLNSFRAYMRTLLASTHTDNPWFREWFSEAYGCAIGTASATKPKCDFTAILNDGPNFEVISEVNNVILGVRALGVALDQTLAFYCGTGYNGICSSFNGAADKGAKFMELLRKVEFDIADTFLSKFKFDGSAGDIPFEVYNYRNNVYERQGTVRPSTNIVTISATTRFSGGKVPFGIETKCPQPCLECLYLFNHQEFIHLAGDVMFSAIFNVHKSGSGPFTCGDLRLYDGALYTEAVKYAVERINSGVSGASLNVKLGFLGYDGCSNPTRAMAILNRINAGQMSLSSNEMTSPDILSWLTYDGQTTKQSASFLGRIGMPLVSPAATLPELKDKTKYSTFFRTVNSDEVIAKAMAQYINDQGWKYVYVLNAPNPSNRQSADAFRGYLKGFGICILAQYEFSTDGSMSVILNAIAAGPSQVVAVFADPDEHIEEMLATKSGIAREFSFIANRPWGPYAPKHYSMLATSASVFFDYQPTSITGFLSYLRAQREVSGDANPWLHDLYEKLFDCNLDTSSDRCTSTNTGLATSALFNEDIWVLSTINAVDSLAKGMHLTLVEKCGASYSSVCPKFLHDSDTRQRLMFHMDAETFNTIENEIFDYINREPKGTVKFLLYFPSSNPQRIGQVDETGTFTYDKTAVRGKYAGIESNCPAGCMVCKDDDADIQAFSYVSGDVYLVGIFDVHKSGSTPFACGELNPKHGTQLLEAFHYALDYVNSGKGIFADLDVMIGGIGLDMCQSASRAANLVANIHSGKTVLRRGPTTINPTQIEGYIGTMDTESSIRVGDVLQQLLIPQISYGATGMELLNRDKYSYFLRSVPADDKMGRAMISYLKKFKYNNIQVIKSFDEIGAPGAKEFERLAQVNLVCITKTYLIGEYGDLKGDAEKIMATIKDTPKARVVVLWMKNPLPVLQVINSHPEVYANTLFVATDKWGGDPVFLDYTSIADLLNQKNLILLDVETADVPGFDSYLADKTPANYQTNPWYKEIFEMYQKCDWDAGTCNQYLTIPRVNDYVQDPYVLYVVNAVFSAALGIQGAVRELCAQSQQRGLCNFYVTNGERRQKILEHLHKINFVDDTLQPFFFTADGQSDRGFHFYNVSIEKVNNVDNFRYENVGSYNDSHFMKLDITYDNGYSAVCDPLRTDDNLEDCVCPFKTDLPTRFMKKDEGGRGLTLMYVGDIHKANPTDPYGCGKINTGVDLHRMLAFFYAIDRINSVADFDLSDSIRLDGVALDSCSSSLRLGQDVYNILSGNQLCDSDETGTVISPSSIIAFIVDKDKNAVPVSSMLSPQGITSISPTATHAVLDDPFHHATFLRTQGSDRDVNKVILEMADQMNWNMMGVVYTDTPEHTSSKNSLLAMAKSRSRRVCVGSMAKLAANASYDDAHHAIDDISQTPGVTGVILFVEPAQFRLLMENSRALGSTGLVWVVPSNWGTVEDDIQNYRSELAGSIWIQSKTRFLDDFNNYVKKLSLTNKLGIPDDWFKEIYETLHGCKILDKQKPESLLFSNLCNGNEKMADSMLAKDPSLLHVVISVYAAALGLNNIPECKTSTSDISACLQLQNEKYQLIYKAIHSVDFEVLPDLLKDKSFQFSFDREGNGEAGYIITSRDESGTAVPLGDYTTRGLNLALSRYTETNSFSQDGMLPLSKCAPGAVCQCNGPNGEIFDFSPEGIRNLVNVQVGERYRDPKSGEVILVQEIPEVNDRFSDIWAIIIMVLAGVGAVLAFSMFVYLLVMYPVRGGTTILGYIVSFGIFLMYLLVFAFIAHATEEVCGLRRFGLGFVYALVYGALLVKLIDCYRVKGKDAAKYSKLGRPLGLFFVTVFLVLIQCMINAEWMILEKPNVERVFYNDMYWPRCTPDDFYDESLVLSLSYVMALIILSFIIGVFTFTQNVNHKESRWIFGVIILSIPCWVIWCAVTVLGSYRMRDAAVTVGLLINATFMLLLMPIRKLYLLSRYNTMIEEEDKQNMNDGNSDYASVYARQYNNRPQMHAGSTYGYPSATPQYQTAQREY